MAKTFVFISNARDGDISGYVLDRARAALSPVSRTKASPMVMPLAIDPDTATLHAAVRRAPYALLSYRIDRTTGELTPLASTPVANSLVNLSFDTSGRWLLGASYGANLLASFRIDTDGRPQGNPASTLAGGEKPHAILPDRNTDLAFVPYLGDDRIHAYRFDAAHGRFAEQPAYSLDAPAGAGPRHATLSADGRFLYVLCELLGTVMVFERASADAPFVELQRVESIPAAAGMMPGRARPPSGVAPTPDDTPDPDSIYCADIHMTPDGRFLYTSERSHGLLSHFSIDPATGRIELIDTLETVASPRSFAIDPAGDFAIVAGQNDSRVALYAIDRTSGRLRLLEHVDGGGDANWVAIASFA
ncbi:MAG TPA: beta-propeller fold lactonase family protein [Paraburkholderia sp.]|nr:beta-propeller fold lactonase family protein [Paraburkholderia sp.]